MGHPSLVRVVCLAGWSIAFAWMVSCSLTVDLDPLTNKICPSDKKPCGEKCVSKTDPATGCALLSCSPCVLNHASATCGPNGQCLISACEETFRNCNKNNDDGCEVNITDDPVYCGSSSCDERSNESCKPPNAERGCANGRCAIGACLRGYADCNNDIADGCEVNTLTNPAHCGGCTKACAVGLSCVDGKCA